MLSIIYSRSLYPLNLTRKLSSFYHKQIYATKFTKFFFLATSPLNGRSRKNIYIYILNRLYLINQLICMCFSKFWSNCSIMYIFKANYISVHFDVCMVFFLLFFFAFCFVFLVTNPVKSHELYLTNNKPEDRN